MIPFNQPFLTGKETEYIVDAVNSKKLSGNGKYTKLCHSFFETHFNFKKTLLTSSCTDALEMASLLTNIQAGDEVIIPSYTFVSTANAFVLRGANIIFADSELNHPNMDISKIESLITPKTKAIVPVHYAGNSCDMDPLMKIAKKHGIKVIEDSAQGFDSYYKGKPVGGIGDIGVFSFHETKNIISGEGGLLVVNQEEDVKRSEIIWEKGTNRAAFFRGEIDKYGWVDLGSSYLPSEVVAAFLYAQIENQAQIQTKRIQIWEQYYKELEVVESKGFIKRPKVPAYATNNGHMFYLICNNIHDREKLINHLKSNNIHAVFHYLSLHKSTFYKEKYVGEELTNADHFSHCLVRLPLFYELTLDQVSIITDSIKAFYLD